MSKLYIKVMTGFYANKKTLRLKAAIGDAAFWVPPRLWAYAAENQPDGIFADYSPGEIASLIGYTGDASSMLEGLLKAGFMDEGPLRIHNWAERNEYHQTYAERAKKAAAARWSKPSPPKPSPDTDSDKDNDRGASIAQASLKQCLKHPPSIKLSERISYEQELNRTTAEIRQLGQLSDYDRDSKQYARLVELLKRQKELCKLLGVVA